MPVAPTQEQLDEIVELIQNAKDDEDAGDLKSANKNRQRALDKVDKYYKIGGNVSGEPKYDPDLKGDGASQPVNGRIKVRIGKDSFVDAKGNPSPARLASTKIHEILGHGAQIVPGNGWKNPDPDFPEDEVEAFNKELEFAKQTGLTPEQIEEIKKQKKHHYDRMPQDRKDFWKKKEPWLAVVKQDDGALFAAGEDIRYVLGTFQASTASQVEGLKGPVRVPRGGGTLSHLVERFGGGDIGLFLRRNPHLSVRLCDLYRLFCGPGSDPADDVPDYPLTMLTPPRTTPGGVLMTRCKSPSPREHRGRR
jgi:hypothetical protein